MFYFFSKQKAFAITSFCEGVNVGINAVKIVFNALTSFCICSIDIAVDLE